MLAKLIKDAKARETFHQRELLKRAMKFVFTNTLNKHIHNKNFEEYSKSLQYFYSQPVIDDSKVKIVRRCTLNNRSRGTIRTFGISRVVLRDMLKEGVIPGYHKAMW